MLRYQSLAVLAFENINQKRACLLARQHVSGQPLSCEESSSLLVHMNAFVEVYGIVYSTRLNE